MRYYNRDYIFKVKLAINYNANNNKRVDYHPNEVVDYYWLNVKNQRINKVGGIKKQEHTPRKQRYLAS